MHSGLALFISILNLEHKIFYAPMDGDRRNIATIGKNWSKSDI